MNENIHQNQEIPAGAGKAAAEANPMRKIILMVGVAIALFLAFTAAYSVHKSIQSSAQPVGDPRFVFPGAGTR